jgi:hypothetical protein
LQLKDGILKSFDELRDKMISLQIFSSSDEADEYAKSLAMALDENPASFLNFEQGHVIARANF